MTPNDYCQPGYCQVPGHPAWHDEQEAPMVQHGMGPQFRLRLNDGKLNRNESNCNCGHAWHDSFNCHAFNCPCMVSVRGLPPSLISLFRQSA